MLKDMSSSRNSPMKKYEFEPLSIKANNLKLERDYEKLLIEKQKL